jgi:hypothetical protein
VAEPDVLDVEDGLSSRGRDRAPQLRLEHPPLSRRRDDGRGSAGTGSVIRPDTVRAYAAEAGFARVDVLPIEHDSWRFYRLVS